MKKIIKKIILILIIIGFIILDIYLIDNFDYNVRKYGIIDKYGNTVIYFKYFYLNSDDLANNEKYISASTKSIFGDEFQDFYIDLDGNEYKDEMPVFSENRAGVYSRSIGKEGYIDSEWNKISEFIYDYTHIYNDGFAKVIIDEKKGLLDLNGNQILSCSYDDIDIITPHFFFCREGSDVYLYNDSETKLGILESEDYITLYNINDLNFETPLSLSDNCFVGDEVIFIKQNEKYAMFNKNGFQIKDYIFNYLDFIYDENSNDAVFKVSEQNGEEYLINTNGDKIFDVLDTNIYEYYNGLLLIEDTNGFGVIDLDRNIIIAPEYSKIIIYDNYIWVKVTDNKFNIYDVNGNLLFKDIKNVVMGGNGEYFVLTKNDKVLVTINVCIILLTVVIIIFFLKNIFNFKRKKIVKKEKILDNNE